MISYSPKNIGKWHGFRELKIRLSKFFVRIKNALVDANLLLKTWIMGLSTTLEMNEQLQSIEKIKALLESGHIPQDLHENLLRELDHLSSYISIPPNFQNEPTEVVGSTSSSNQEEQDSIIPKWRLKQLIDGMPVAITFVNKDCIYQFDNPRHRNWYGQSESEVLGSHLQDMVGEKLFKYVIEPIINRALKGEMVTHEVPFSSPSGKSKYYRITYKPAYHTDGHIDGVYIYAEDVTALKEKSRALKFRESVLRTCLESIPDSFFAVNRENEILLLNEIAKNLFKKLHRLEVDEGTNVRTALQQKDAKTKAFWKEELYAKVFAGETHELLYDYVNKKGECVYFSSKIAPIFDEERQVTGAIFTSRDVTELKRKENSLSDKNKELQRYIESNLQLENFAHLASHDLKAPLNTILNFTNLLNQKAKHKLNEVEQDFVRFTIKAATNMQETIDALLRFSQVSNDKIKIACFNPTELIDDLKKDLSTTIEANRGVVIVNDLPDEITGDRALIREVFQNLILNGIKFVQKDIIPEIIISSSDQKSFWAFSIKDNGIGIAEEFQKRIFVMFKRLHKKEAYEGTGMGLAVCKKIIEQHQGKIWVESQIGKGCIFHFSIAKNINFVQ